MKKLLAPRFIVLDSSNKQDENSPASRNWRPDISVYKERTYPKLNKNKPNQLDKVDLVVEVKRYNSGEVAWEASARSDEFMPEGGAESRGQNYAALREVVKRQSRNHAFLLYIHDPWFTVVRVDHAGVIVSERVNMRTDPRPVLEFFHRYASADDAHRGLDTSRRRVTDPKVLDAIKKELEDSGDKDADWTLPLIEFDVPNGGGEPIKVYGVKQHIIPDDLLGRCTSTWTVWIREYLTKAFMKDTWRVEAAEVKPESDIIGELHKKKVPHIPTILYGGDLPGPGQVTKSQDFDEEGIDKRCHHRLLEKIVPSFVEKAPTPKAMFTAIYHAFQGRFGASSIFEWF